MLANDERNVVPVVSLLRLYNVHVMSRVCIVLHVLHVATQQLHVLHVCIYNNTSL